MGRFGATIDWGDGTTSTGVVRGSDGSYSVTGSHTYVGRGAAPADDAVFVSGFRWAWWEDGGEGRSPDRLLAGLAAAFLMGCREPGADPRPAGERGRGRIGGRGRGSS